MRMKKGPGFSGVFCLSLLLSDLGSNLRGLFIVLLQPRHALLLVKELLFQDLYGLGID